MAEYIRDEVVDITIKGARVYRHYDDPPRTLAIVVALGNADQTLRFSVPIDAAGVEITRTAPPEWPPQPGDLWRDRDGHLWFAYLGYVDGDAVLDLRCQNSTRSVYPYGPDGPDPVLEQYGPMVLVRREERDGEQDGGA